ncbi:four-jointed box protein 1-like [Babylonia areolata]
MVTGAVWSRRLEDACPKGFEAQEASWWRRKVAGMQVVRVEEGCGRMQNRRVTFTDGSQACARYRFNTDQLQGELYSYHLARLLNITRLPPALLLPVHSLSPQWRGVHLALSTAQWTDGRPVILTRWLPHLTPAYIPPPLRQDDRRLHPTWDTLGGRTLPELCDLLQWSDLIVFDYLTANLDRLVNNMFNRQWNTEMMNNPAHNLERTEAGSLVFLDNESGLFHGYRLLDKYQGYHQALLASLCVFRDSTARAVKTLHASGTVGQQLQQLVRAGEPHHALLPALPDKNLHVLTDRLAAVHRHILTCEALYPR